MPPIIKDHPRQRTSTIKIGYLCCKIHQLSQRCFCEMGFGREDKQKICERILRTVYSLWYLVRKDFGDEELMTKPKDPTTKKLSRRDFVKTTAVSITGTALAGIRPARAQTAKARTAVSAEEQKVLDANQHFYSALENLNLEQMDTVWLQEDWVRCVHPGRSLLDGWEAVRKSWQDIFDSTTSMRVTAAIQFVHVESSTAWVCCTEKLSTAVGERVSEGYEQATNIFEKRRGKWLLVHHHASPLPRPWPGNA